MVENAKHPIIIDLNQFKLHIHLKDKIELTVHFDSTSRRFYLSVIAFVVNEMKKLGKITSISLEEHLDMLALLNETVGGSAGSSDKENLLLRIYRKWKDALPNLEEAPLFKVLGRKKEYGEGTGRTYLFTEAEKDSWANLFEYKGSEENVRLKFAIDKIGVNLEDIVIIYEESLNGGAWDKFVSGLKRVGTKAEAGQTAKESEASISSPKNWKIALPSRYRWVALIVTLIVVLGTITLAIRKTYLKPASVNVASTEKMAYPLPDKPSIAVLPFENLSDDPKQNFFSDGITDEIITVLSKSPYLFVIARNSTFTYKGKSENVRQVAEEMGVRYVLEGSVRREENRVRITAQLIDTTTGKHLFSEQYDRDLKHMFAIQDEITMKILTAMRVKLSYGEQERMMAKGTKNIEAYLKVLQAWEYRQTFTKESQAMSRQLAEEAIALDPGYALAYSCVAGAIGNEVWVGAYENPKEALDRAMGLAQKGIAIDESLAYAHIALGFLSIMLTKDYEKGIAEAERAVALEPNSAESYIQLALHLTWAGRSKEAIPFFKKAVRLSPISTWRCLNGMALAYKNLGDYDEAIAIYEKILRKQPDQLISHLNLTATLMLAGREKEARAHAAEVLTIDPKFSLERYVKTLPFKNPADMNDRLIEPALKAGLK